jgi:Ca2+-binding EF-hand superfamily protein
LGKDAIDGGRRSARRAGNFEGFGMNKILTIAAVAAFGFAAQAEAQDAAPAPTPQAQSQAAPQANLRGNWLQEDQTRSQAQQRADKMFQRLDANHDGALTRAEAQQASAQMSHGGAKVERLMASLFGQGDSVTLAEFEAQALARFDRQDLNHDGVVSADERQQARTARAQERGGN